MRSLLAAVLEPLPASARSAPHRRATIAHRPSARYRSRASAEAAPLDHIAADGQPLVRPYLVVWERERDEHERRLRWERRRVASSRQDRLPWEVAV